MKSLFSPHFLLELDFVMEILFLLKILPAIETTFVSPSASFLSKVPEVSSIIQSIGIWISLCPAWSPALPCFPAHNCPTRAWIKLTFPSPELCSHLASAPATPGGQECRVVRGRLHRGYTPSWRVAGPPWCTSPGGSWPSLFLT